jgi:hypothetical protein
LYDYLYCRRFADLVPINSFQLRLLISESAGLYY